MLQTPSIQQYNELLPPSNPKLSKSADYTETLPANNAPDKLADKSNESVRTLSLTNDPDACT